MYCSRKPLEFSVEMRKALLAVRAYHLLKHSSARREKEQHTFNTRLLTVTFSAALQTSKSVNQTADSTQFHIHKENKPWGYWRDVQRGLPVRFHPLLNTSAGNKTLPLCAFVRWIWFINGTPWEKALTEEMLFNPICSRLAFPPEHFRVHWIKKRARVWRLPQCNVLFKGGVEVNRIEGMMYKDYTHGERVGVD